MNYLLFALVVYVATSAAVAQSLPPERTVEGTVVVSTKDPSARISVPPQATYVGAARFALFGVADCEIHLFVEADQSKKVKRIFWVQFEGYLPEHPKLVYSKHPAYSSTSLSGLPFYHRARFGQSTDPIEPGSDAERVFSMLKEKGFTVPPETVNVTYKHFLDSTMRKELMLIVIEDMSTTGTTLAQLVRDNKVQPVWASVAARLLGREPKPFTVTLNASGKK
jgi:hypothetical protein